jgi:nitrogen fixation protein NifQ
MIVLARARGATAADELYRQLLLGLPPGRDSLDAHVLASALALSAAEATAESLPLTACTGLSRPRLDALFETWFPDAALSEAFATRPGERANVHSSEEERCLRELLLSCASAAPPLGEQLASIIARRAQRPRHLWQDLGLRSRDELSRLMARHFPLLKARNRSDMKWKKFFARSLCLDGIIPICTAPTCGECGDFDGCFGDESGESLLARRHR